MNRLNYIAVLAITSLLFVVTFQNCSGTQFASQSAVTDSSSGPIAGQGANNTLPVEIVGFSSNLSTITVGQKVILTFDVRNATSAVINPGSINVMGQTNIELSPTANMSYSLTATNSLGSATRTLNIVVQAVLPVIDSFAANPANITNGGSSILMFSARNFSSLTIDPGNTDVSNAASLSVSPSSTTVYTLRARNSTGQVVTRTTTVTVNNAPPPAPPVIGSFSASQTTITAGGSTTLSWTVSGATSITLMPDNIANLPASGSRSVTPPATRTYTLMATNSGGTVSRDVTITVNTAVPLPVISAFSTTTPYFFPGVPVTVSWSVSGTTSLVLNPGNNVVTNMTSFTETLTASKTYVLVATNSAGQQVTRNLDVMAIQPWVINAPISLAANTGTFDLNTSLPAGVKRGGTFAVDPTGAALPSGMILSAAGMLSAGTAAAGASATGVVFAYTEP